MNNSIKKIILRILDISYRNNLSHIGSAICAAEIIYDIYNIKRKDDIFLLSEGHAFLAQLCVMEFFGIIKNAEELCLKYGTHPKKDLENKIHLSTGSLGMGLSVSVGFALAEKEKDIYCLISDGEIAEGVCWESFHFINNLPKAENNFRNLDNLAIYVNANGYSALGEVNIRKLQKELSGFEYCRIMIRDTSRTVPLFFKGLKSHYQVLNEEEYKKLKEYYEQL